MSRVAAGAFELYGGVRSMVWHNWRRTWVLPTGLRIGLLFASATPVLPGSMLRGHLAWVVSDLVGNQQAAAETRYLHTHLLFYWHGL